MTIIFEPERDNRHDCAEALHDLGDRPLGTRVACVCGKRWEAVRSSFWNWVTLRLLDTRPMRTWPHNRIAREWRYYGHETADWDDVSGKEMRRDA